MKTGFSVFVWGTSSFRNSIKLVTLKSRHKSSFPFNQNAFKPETMKLNRIQIQILKKLSQERNLDIDAYIQQFSQEFLGIPKKCLDELSEAEADAWIHNAYMATLR
nr:hypothetical protein [uncultured Desulfobulbus sp.]